MTGRPYKSSATPDPTPAERLGLITLITPPIRSKGEYTLLMDRLLVGDVLDTEPRPPCVIRARSYSEKKQRAWVFRKPCGRRSCPVCVTSWVADNVAGSWAYWQGRASWVLLDDPNAERRWRHKSKLRIRGEQANPGVLSLPIRYGDQRVVFYPSAEEMDSEILVHAVRVLPVTVPETVKAAAEASIHRGTIPPYISDSVIQDAASAAGFHYRGGRVWSADGVTPEQYRYHLELLR